MHAWDEVKMALAQTPGPAYAITSLRAGRAPSVAEMSAMGQAINTVPFLLPGVHEVWDLLLKVKETGECSPIDDYVEKMNFTQGTERYVGWGDAFIGPNYDDVRRMEEKYLPAEKQRATSTTPTPESFRPRIGALAA